MTSDRKHDEGTEANAQRPSSHPGDAAPGGASAAGAPEAFTHETPDVGDEGAQMPEAAELARLRAEAAELKDRLLRSHAEMDNVRKRLEREKAEQAKYAISNFARDVLGIGDNVQRALDAVPHRMLEQDQALKSFVEGVTMIERELLTVLARHGITRLDPKGAPFDPHQHQAVVEVPSADVPTGTVTQVFQAGYKIEDRILRPAMVAVARGGPKPQAPAEAATPPDVPPADASSPDDGAPRGETGEDGR